MKVLLLIEQTFTTSQENITWSPWCPLLFNISSPWIYYSWHKFVIRNIEMIWKCTVWGGGVWWWWWGYSHVKTYGHVLQKWVVFFARIPNYGSDFRPISWKNPQTKKITPAHGYGSWAASGTSPTNPNLRTPPPPWYGSSCKPLRWTIQCVFYLKCQNVFCWSQLLNLKHVLSALLEWNLIMECLWSDKRFISIIFDLI